MKAESSAGADTRMMGSPTVHCGVTSRAPLTRLPDNRSQVTLSGS